MIKKNIEIELPHEACRNCENLKVTKIREVEMVNCDTEKTEFYICDYGCEHAKTCRNAFDRFRDLLRERDERPYDALGDDQGRGGYTADEAYRKEFVERYDDQEEQGWATPTLYLDSFAVPCFVYESDNTEEWNHATKWPRSAVEILEAKEETHRITIYADDLLRILDIMEADAEEHPEVGLKPAPMIREIKKIVVALAEGLVVEPGEMIIPLKYVRGGVLRKK